MRTTLVRAATATLAGLALALGTAACGTGDDYARVCTDRTTHHRVDDRRCDRHNANTSWWYVPYGYSTPPVGRRVDTAHGTTRKPAGATVRRGVPARGSRVGGSAARPGNPAGGGPAPARPAPARPAPRIR